MARKYTRDNRGRFASVGATARGGRLTTASGKKRETQTAKIKGGGASGTIGKPKGLKPGAIKAKPAAKPAAAKPGASAPARRRGAVGKIDDAKAGRIIGRIDANRPGLRRASGSARKTANAIKTQRKAVDFALAAGARARKQGKSLSVNDSLRRAVANAAKKRRRSG